MKLYHGSNIAIENVDLTMSKPNKDFGRAFYLSPEVGQARVMAAFKAELLGGNGVVTEFEIDSFEGLNVKTFESYSEEWAHFVYDHRTFPETNIKDNFDVIYGPIANDKIGAQITRFKQGYISFDEFLRRIKYIKGVTFQYAFCSQNAIDRLKKL